VWQDVVSMPGVRRCAQCTALRDMAPQHHLYVLRGDPQGRIQKIDTEIIRLVEQAWRADVETTGSCQGGCATEPRAKVEFYAEHLPVMQDLFGSLPGVEFVPAGPVVVMYIEAPSVCPMRAVEEDLVERGLTPRLHAV
jgi:hypothetical protein